MRIIAGKYRHRIINYPKNQSETRPTKDRVRESMFNALGDISELVALDLFAGSGSLGLEALSRGAKKCLFVDSSKDAIKIIKNNLDSLEINKDEYSLYFSDYQIALEQLKNTKVDLLLLDPPYKMDVYEDIIKKCDELNILHNKSIIVCEADHILPLDESLFTKRKDYKHGEIYVTILWR